jgi:glycosyltransferase involved in cell wall biosynthesis
MNLTVSIADQNFERAKSLGILNVSLNLLRRLSRHPGVDALSVLSNHTLRDRLALGPDAQVTEHDLPLRSPVHRIFWDQWQVYTEAARTGHPWLFLPKGYASFLRPCPVHLAVEINDGMNDHYRRHYPRAVSPLELHYFIASMKAALRHANLLFTISDFTRDEVLRLATEFKITAPPVITMGIGFSDDDPVLRGGAGGDTPRRDIVALVSRWPHKKTRMLLDLLAAWRTESPFDGTIHLIGALPDGVTPPPGTTFLPRPSNERYGELLRTARAVIFTSEYEGFGMPPVEATLCGAAAVYSDIPVAREVMGTAGFPFTNHDPDSFATALNHALATPPATIAAWAADLRARHHWDRVADRVLAGLKEHTPR